MTPKCPRCDTPITTAPDDQGFLTCPGCGTRLRSVHAGPSVTPTDIHNVISEIHDLRRMQGEILQMQALILAQLKSSMRSTAEAAESVEHPAPAKTGTGEEPSDEAPPVPRVRRRRKSALIVDDDPATLKTAVEALEHAQVPLRTATNGNEALAALAEEKPDVLVVELAIGDPMPGKDFINMVKSTMEWVDTPIVFHTRLPIESREEARSAHGGDELVLKGPGSAEALVNRVIQLFQQHH